MARTTTISLQDVTDRARHGGKAAALAALIRHGLPAPDGLVLPADLTDAQVAAAIDDVLTWAASTNTVHGLVARSSAPAEDGAKASFAGLYASRFAPARSDALLNAVRDVRAAATAPAIRAYAALRNITTPPGIAVLIQRTIRPYASGVLAAEIDHGIIRRWTLEAVHGLAIPVVSGTQRGERHHSDSETPSPAAQSEIILPGTPTELHQPPGEWIILPGIDNRPGQRAKIRTSGAGLLHLYPPDTDRHRPVLTAALRDQLVETAAIVAAVLQHTSIDIEWAVTPDGAIHILQARPLTSPIPEQPTLTHSAGTVWTGLPAAPGRGTGPAHRLAAGASPAIGPAPDQAVILSDNLGADALDALLHNPAGIAATRGGPLSHAAIVAREIGVPCATALPDDLLTIPAGTPITVDGIAGTAEIAAPRDKSPRQQKLRVAGAAVITRPLSKDASCDGRVGTLLLHLPGDRLTRTLEETTTAPIGVLQPSEQPDLSPLPPGYREHHLPGIGRIAWPAQEVAIPRRLVVLHGDEPIFERRIAPFDPAINT